MDEQNFGQISQVLLRQNYVKVLCWIFETRELTKTIQPNFWTSAYSLENCIIWPSNIWLLLLTTSFHALYKTHHAYTSFWNGLYVKSIRIKWLAVLDATPTPETFLSISSINCPRNKSKIRKQCCKLSTWPHSLLIRSLISAIVLPIRNSSALFWLMKGDAELWFLLWLEFIE